MRKIICPNGRLIFTQLVSSWAPHCTPSLTTHISLVFSILACKLESPLVPSSTKRYLNFVFFTHCPFCYIFFYFLKCLFLKQKNLGQTTNCQIVKLLSNDVNRFDLSVLFLHYLWVGPIQTLISMAILLNVIGPSCLVGLGVLILFVPLQGLLIFKLQS